ncbi:amino acid ABC transporter ATP-binding protein [Celerinatantimonas sp. MCCC 1A17872]|uniref:amino acid ABC transporter ATP-binding protein n=1 Tax=Celerinatantimonas sp. MCCC 1A17872 TaxID=3177514 RepID=UPI0038CB3761
MSKKEKPLLEIIGVDKYFDQNQVLKNCCVNVHSTETVVLIGPSGSGKSTLLRCVNMLAPPENGDIFFDNKNISGGDISPYKLRQRIGMVFQNYELFSHLSAAENIMLAPMTVLGLNRIDARKQAEQLLAKVHLQQRSEHFPDELSGGQQQRVAIARALAMKPDLMLYDEPTSALDPEMIREVLDVMAELSAEGMTSMVVTHEMGFARRAANKILFMEDGEIIEQASANDFFSSNVSQRARRFLDQILH